MSAASSTHIWQALRWASMPTNVISAVPVRSATRLGRRWAKRQGRVRARARPGGSQGRPGATSGWQPIGHARPALPTPPREPRSPVCEAMPACPPDPQGGGSCADGARSYTRHRSLAMLFAVRGMRHLRTGGKLERVHQNMAREWGHGVVYPSSRHRQRALRYWIHHYNERRPHGALGGQALIGRVRYLWRSDIERRWAGWRRVRMLR